MDNKSAYVHLAKWFEYLNDDCGYQQWSQYLIDTLKEYPLSCGLDIGCGGGWFTRALQKHGYMMTGMDISPEMLDFAQQQALRLGVRSEYILGDITKKKLPKKFDFITAINDCINYIPKEKLGSALKNVAAMLKKGGIFFFDISSKRKFERKIANTVSVDDRDEVTYLSFNKQEGDKITMEVTLFSKNPDGSYTRADETHIQYAYEIEELSTALSAAGLNVLLIEGHLHTDEKTADRICILAQKE